MESLKNFSNSMDITEINIQWNKEQLTCINGHFGLLCIAKNIKITLKKNLFA